MKINIPTEDSDLSVVTRYTYSDYLDNPGTFTKMRFSIGETLHTGEIEDMCQHYPALDKAFRNFMDMYHVCRDDYYNKLNKKGSNE